jgi:hypothetical protein
MSSVFLVLKTIVYGIVATLLTAHHVSGLRQEWDTLSWFQQELVRELDRLGCWFNTLA